MFFSDISIAFSFNIAEAKYRFDWRQISYSVARGWSQAPPDYFFVFSSKKLYLQPEVWLGSGELLRKSNRKLGCISHSGGIAIFVNRLFCDWQSEPAICDDVLVSSFTAFMQVTKFIIWCRPMQYLVLWSDLLHLQDQENIIFHVLMERKINLYILTKIFENLKVITL